MTADDQGVSAPAISERDRIRGKVFSSAPNFDTVEFNGSKIEIRQPTLGEIFQIQQAAGEDLLYNTITMLIKYCFVPGTNENVFEEADREQLAHLPFNVDLQKLSKALNALIGGQQLDAAAKDAVKSTENKLH